MHGLYAGIRVCIVNVIVAVRGCLCVAEFVKSSVYACVFTECCVREFLLGFIEDPPVDSLFFPCVNLIPRSVVITVLLSLLLYVSQFMCVIAGLVEGFGGFRTPLF